MGNVHAPTARATFVIAKSAGANARTALLVAHNGMGDRVLAAFATRGDAFCCPECRADVILKRGTEVVPHFAHRAYSGCPMSVGESLRHLEMKLQIGKLFGAAEYEIRFGAERRADVVARDTVVECQASPIGIEEMDARTRFYNGQGKPVLWVFDIGRLAGQEKQWATTIDSIRTLGEVRVPAEMRWLHRTAYGFLYVLDRFGRLYGCHLAPCEARESAYLGTFTMPKTLRRPRFHRAGDTPSAFWSVDRLHRFVRCGEGVWWKREVRE